LAEAPTNVAPCSHWHSRRCRPSRVRALIVLGTAPCSRSSAPPPPRPTHARAAALGPRRAPLDRAARSSGERSSPAPLPFRSSHRARHP
jgi:hypothetical protein